MLFHSDDDARHSCSHSLGDSLWILCGSMDEWKCADINVNIAKSAGGGVYILFPRNYTKFMRL